MPLTLLAIFLKLVGTGCLFALLFTTVNEAKKGLESAARPMIILGNMLRQWVINKKATTTQIEAWWDARRSFLYNEVAMTLDKYDNIVIGYLFVAVLIVGEEAIRIAFLKQQAHTVLLPFGGLLVFFSYVNLSAAMKCELEQKKHILLFEDMKASLTRNTPEQQRVIMTIDHKVRAMEKRDFQTKMCFFPLNPKLVSALAAYFASSGGAIIYGLVFH